MCAFTPCAHTLLSLLNLHTVPPHLSLNTLCPLTPVLLCPISSCSCVFTPRVLTPVLSHPCASPPYSFTYLCPHTSSPSPLFFNTLCPWSCMSSHPCAFTPYDFTPLPSLKDAIVITPPSASFPYTRICLTQTSHLFQSEVIASIHTVHMILSKSDFLPQPLHFQNLSLPLLLHV